MCTNLYQAQVIKSVWVTPSTFLLRFILDEEFEFKAGQKISILVPPFIGKEPTRASLHALAASPLEARALGHEVLVRWRPGDITSNFLLQLKPRDTFFVRGPYEGVTFKDQAPEQEAVFLGVGDGIATIKALVGSEEYRRRPPKKTVCIQGVTSSRERVFQDYFEKRGVDLVTCISKEVTEGAYPGQITDFLQSTQVRWEWETAVFYIFGSEKLVAEASRILSENYSVPSDRIHFESVPPISQGPAGELSLLDLGREHKLRKVA